MGSSAKFLAAMALRVKPPSIVAWTECFRAKCPTVCARPARSQLPSKRLKESPALPARGSCMDRAASAHVTKVSLELPRNCDVKMDNWKGCHLFALV